MNSSQNEIFKRLEKIKSNRLTKRQNLGAIEDAINEVTNNIKNKENELKNISDSLRDELQNVSLSIGQQIDTLMSVMAGSSNQFDTAFKEYKDMLSELTSANIDYDTSNVESIYDDFQLNKEDANMILDIRV
jgi:aspartate ammonia-lyase